MAKIKVMFKATAASYTCNYVNKAVVKDINEISINSGKEDFSIIHLNRKLSKEHTYENNMSSLQTTC
ncbi:hypothetical protein QPK14_14940 [Photorhabdus temperata subsp. temperata]